MEALESFWVVAMIAVPILIVGIVAFAARESPEQKKERLKREADRLAREQDAYRRAREESERRNRVAIEQRERTKAAKREKRKETISKAAATPFAAAGIAAGVTRAAYDHTKKQFGPESEPGTFCPQCGGDMQPEFRFCPTCSAPSIRSTRDG
ncbi:hypothetical protein ACFL5T_02705 [Gemmatimonadota bacterium]